MGERKGEEEVGGGRGSINNSIIDHNTKFAVILLGIFGPALFIGAFLAITEYILKRFEKNSIKTVFYCALIVQTASMCNLFYLFMKKVIFSENE